MPLVFGALAGKIELEVGDNFGVCVLNVRAGLRKNESKENEISSCSGSMK